MHELPVQALASQLGLPDCTCSGTSVAYVMTRIVAVAKGGKFACQSTGGIRQAGAREKPAEAASGKELKLIFSRIDADRV